MEKEQQAEWHQLRDKAISSLRNCEYLSKKTGMLVAQFLILPFFQPCQSWNIFSRGDNRLDKHDHFAVYACWDSSLDIEKFRTPIERLKYPQQLRPTIEFRQLEIESGVLTSWLDQLSKVQISVGVQSRKFGVDGTTYEIALGAYPWSHNRISWREEPPEEWEGLGKVMKEMISYLSKVFEPKT